MKTILTLLVALALPFFTLAQQGLQKMDRGSYDPKQQRNEIAKDRPTVNTMVLKTNTSQVIQSTGKTYDGDQLTQMARKDINSIAGTVAGVETRAGEVPNIRNAGPAGTAYFVDGVRTYGALPILTK